MAYSISYIATVIGASIYMEKGTSISHLLIDSRKIVFPEASLFFAITGPRRDGHQFIPEVYARGVRAFVVQKGFDYTAHEGAVFLEVTDVLKALQELAANHRHQFAIPVMGITGSNGKTIVKEWLYRLLQPDQSIVRSPRSYNSQIGVPLSVWEMNPSHTLAIIEAGISTVNEMEKLQRVIEPTIGIFTNLSSAHNEGFADNRVKALEKAKLFTDVQQLFFCREALEPDLFPDGSDRQLFPSVHSFFSWSRRSAATLQITGETTAYGQTRLTAHFEKREIYLQIPFTDKISVDNAITCWCVMLSYQYESSIIQQRMLLLEPVDMRMQLKKGINHCYLLNDSYSNDLPSLGLALDYLKQQADQLPTTLILSDVLESGQTDQQLYTQIAFQVNSRNIDRVIGIGPHISAHRALFTHAFFYDSTETFLQQANTHQFRNEYILLKGARVFAFERITHWLEEKVHQTVMEIDLSALVHNLKAYQQYLKPDTRLMGMVKAFSYGSGSAEVARVLQFHQVDYLAVAYADEGVELRKGGISLPIMVMGAEAATFHALVTHYLEPEIYSFAMYHAFENYLKNEGIRQFPVHIKFNTGMNRLGFEVHEAEQVGAALNQSDAMVVKSVFSHLAASENPHLTDFTAQQMELFEQACAVMHQQLGYSFIRHIANSAAIFRQPEYQYDMVRLGIGLYGLDPLAVPELMLQTVASLRSTIAQIRRVKAGGTIGYNRKGVLQRDSLIATVRIGYADGYSRQFGNGRGWMYLHGHRAPVTGNVCMDMTMIDVTDIPHVQEGDSVEIFGPNLPIEELAGWAHTIVYEVLTGISQRVARVYVSS